MSFALRRFAGAAFRGRVARMAPSASLFTASRPVFAEAAKTTTGLTGLPVVPNAREVLCSLYKKTIRTAQAFDDTIPYNEHIINLCKVRMAAVEANQSIKAIEEEIGCGQVEELITQAEDELELLFVMNEDFRVWEDDPEAEAEYASWGNGSHEPPLAMPDDAEFEAAGFGDFSKDPLPASFANAQPQPAFK